MHFAIFAFILVFVVGLVIGLFGWMAIAVLCALIAIATIIVLASVAMSSTKSRNEPDRDSMVGGDFKTWLIEEQRRESDTVRGADTEGFYPSGRPYGYYTRLAAERDKDRLEG